MKKIAVIGESPYDTKPLCKVWNSQFGLQGQFHPKLEKFTGSNLDSIPKLTKEIKARRIDKEYELIIFVRDLDAPRSNNNEFKIRQDWFLRLASTFSGSLFLLNIQELEALILGDIDTFNKMFKTTTKFSGNPESKDSPKDFFITETYKTRKRFGVSDNEKLIPLLDFEKVKAKCQFYSEFIQELETQLA